MISITIFIIYNILFAFALIPPDNLQATQVRTSSSKIEHEYKKRSSLPEVYMHILVNSNEEVDLKNYLPYIETLANEHLDFKYNFIVVLNDMFTEENSLSAEEKNEIALNSLWSNEHPEQKHKVIKNNIIIEYVKLSKYMHESPIRKHWRQLPRHYIEFIIRAVSIWEKGGIALNPVILTPKSPHAIYKEKLSNILTEYAKCNVHKLNEVRPKKYLQQKPIAHHKEKNKKKVNNIRDIIANLEHEDYSSNLSQVILTEAESQINPATVHRHLLSNTTHLNITEANKDQLNYVVVNPNYYSYMNDNKTNNLHGKELSNNDAKAPEIINERSIREIELMSESIENNKTSIGLLPLFLEFLFHEKHNDTILKINAEKETNHNITRQRKSVIPTENPKISGNVTSFVVPSKLDSKLSDKYDPVIISAKDITFQEQNKINETNNENHLHDHVELTLDLEGIIMATKTPCHAFLGTVFSNVIHHTEEETLKDLIIAELSIFCKGLLSSCNGIDVILL